MNKVIEIQSSLFFISYTKLKIFTLKELRVWSFKEQPEVFNEIKVNANMVPPFYHQMVKITFPLFYRLWFIYPVEIVVNDCIRILRHSQHQIIFTKWFIGKVIETHRPFLIAISVLNYSLFHLLSFELLSILKLWKPREKEKPIEKFDFVHKSHSSIVGRGRVSDSMLFY